ncbi:MAG: undecaprenyl diphosphate synthase family protein, partial [Pseudomonadota bacterium]|nr:undecaprenyl diphosphate synthase family protein [Pseudomonadota bacterium]
MALSIPHHLAIIMDGNRRWAKQRGLPLRSGHMQGSVAVEQIIEHASKKDIPWLTLFAFSTENWSRPAREV